MAVQTETIQVSGVRCEQCVMRLAGALERLDGIESATANLMGEVSLSWDDSRVSRGTIVDALAHAGFKLAA